MKRIKKVNALPICDTCKDFAIYDAPTKTGQWAYMCEGCAKTHSNPSKLNIGTKFVLREKSDVEPSKTVLKGIEVNNLEQVLIEDCDREIKCPNYGEYKTVEPDADYIYTCEDCGSRVQVPDMD